MLRKTPYICQNLPVSLDKKNSCGFTLIEMLVSVTVFVMVTTIALGIYVSILKANKKTISLTRLQRDAQVIMLALAKKIRQSRVDYNYTGYGGSIPQPTTELALIDIDGATYLFGLDDINDTVQVSVNNGAAVDIPAGNVAITDLRFFVEPAEDPFLVTPSQAPNFPRVTMVLRLEPKQASGMYESALIVQQTVPQRGGGY